MRQLRYFTLILLLYSFNCFSQERNYFLQQHLNSENGLPQNSIRDLVFSPSGYLWIATEDGLVRFDGKNCKIYSALNSGLSKNRILQLLLFNDKKLYCVTEGNLVFVIDEQENKVNIHQVEELNHIGFSSFHLFKSENLTQLKKICNLLVPENLEQFDKTSFVVLENMNYIIQRDSKGLLVYDHHLSFIKHIDIPKCFAIDIFQLKNQLIYKTNQDNFFHVDIEHEKITPLSKSEITLETNIHHGNQLNENKLFWDYKTSKTFQIKHNQLFEIKIDQGRLNFSKIALSLPNDAIYNITTSENNQTLLIGTLSNGLYIFRKKEFQVRISPYSSNIFYAQALYKNNQSILTTQPFQEFKKNQEINYLNYHPRNELTSFVDAKNNFWYCIADTLESLNLHTMKVTRRITIPNNAGTGLGFISPKDSSSFYITSNKSLYSYKIDSGLVKLVDYPTRKKIERVYCILTSTDSFLYIGSSRGILKYNKKTLKLNAQILDNTIVRTLFKTSTGLILAGTYGNGYFAVQHNKPISIPLDRNNGLKTVHAFIEDKHGNLWLSSNNGLFKISLKEISNFIQQPNSQTFYYYRYSHIDGLHTNEFNGGCYPSSIQLDSSTWSLPSMQGLVWFKPDSLPTSFDNSSISIDKLMLNDSLIQIGPDNRLNIQDPHFKLSVFVSSPHWSDESNLYIEYKFKQEKSWNLLQNNAEPIVIQNLPGGEHTLLIRKKNGFNNLSFSTIQITLIVSKRLYEYGWFWPLAIIGLGIFIYLINKFTHQRIQQRKEKLERLVSTKTAELKASVLNLEVKNTVIEEAKNKLKQENDLKKNLLYVLSHDIATPLSYMNLALSHATKTTNQTTLDYDDLVDLKIAAQNLKSLLDNIVAWIKQSDESDTHTTIQEIDLNKLVNDKIKLFDIINKKKMNTISNLIPINTKVNSDLFIISMAIQNLLGNAINYTKNGQIDISYTRSNKGHQISIRDNGIGIQASKNQGSQFTPMDHDQSIVGYGIGLKITDELLKLIDGEISIKSNFDSQGTNAMIYIRT